LPKLSIPTTRLVSRQHQRILYRFARLCTVKYKFPQRQDIPANPISSRPFKQKREEGFDAQEKRCCHICAVSFKMTCGCFFALSLFVSERVFACTDPGACIHVSLGSNTLGFLHKEGLLPQNIQHRFDGNLSELEFCNAMFDFFDSSSDSTCLLMNFHAGCEIYFDLSCASNMKKIAEMEKQRRNQEYLKKIEDARRQRDQLDQAEYERTVSYEILQWWNLGFNYTRKIFQLLSRAIE